MKRVSPFLPRIKFHEKNRRRHIIFRSSFFPILPLNRSFQLSFDIGNPIVYFLLAFEYFFKQSTLHFFPLYSLSALPRRRRKKKNSENVEKSNRRKEGRKEGVKKTGVALVTETHTWLRTNTRWNMTVERSRALVIRQSSLDDGTTAPFKGASFNCFQELLLLWRNFRNIVDYSSSKIFPARVTGKR